MKYYGKEWYNNECRPIERNKEYIDYMNKCLPKWYNDISLHDSRIIRVKKNKDLVVLNLEHDDYEHTNYQFLLYNPIIIEDCRLNRCWCISNEIYINDNSCEFHLMVGSEDDEQRLDYFTVECAKIEMRMNGECYTISSLNNQKILQGECDETTFAI